MALLIVEQQAAVDLVRADHEIAAFAHLGERHELVTGEGAANRIVRIAQQEKPRAGIDGTVERGRIELPAVVGLHEWRALQSAIGVQRRRQERRIDRHPGDHRIAG